MANQSDAASLPFRWCFIDRVTTAGFFSEKARIGGFQGLDRMFPCVRPRLPTRLLPRAFSSKAFDHQQPLRVFPTGPVVTR